MVKIRLRRIGAKKSPSYRIVVADSRAPRDGAFLANIGHYNPLTDPETIVIDQEKAQKWLKSGAQPTDTAARLLAKAGIIEEPADRKEKMKAGAPKGKVSKKKRAKAAAEEPKAEAAEKSEASKKEPEAAVTEEPEAGVTEEPKASKEGAESGTTEEPAISEEPAEPTTTEPHEPVTVLLWTTQEGKAPYTITLTIAGLLQERHPWIKAETISTLGVADATNKMASLPLADKSRSFNFGGAVKYILQAQEGAKSYTHAMDDMRVFGTGQGVMNGFYTYEEDIRTPEDIFDFFSRTFWAFQY